MIKLDIDQARRNIVSCQKFKSSSLQEKAGANSVIEYLGYVQIDTINVICRAHEHVIFSRMPDFTGSHLDMQYKTRSIFEYWSHAMALLPIASFKHTLLRKSQFKWRYPEYTTKEFKKLTAKVFKRIEEEGALSSADFKSEKKTGIWEWKPAKAALETLYHQGKLMVLKRDNFRRIYDLTERVYPESQNIEIPSEDETAIYQINKALQVNAVMTRREIDEYLRFAPGKAISRNISSLINAGQIKIVLIEGREYLSKAELSTEPALSDRMLILSPFDNMLINRKRMEFFFGAAYRLECYMPAAKRKLGYFALPLLYRDEIIGYIDLKAERKRGELIVKNLLALRKLSKTEKSKLDKALQEFALFNSCSKIRNSF